MNFFRHWIAKFGLWSRIAIAVSIGFFTLFITFTVLAETSLQKSGARILEERLATTQFAAYQIDIWLQDHIDELAHAQVGLEIEGNGSALQEQADALAAAFARKGIFSQGFFITDSQGNVILSRPERLYPSGKKLAGSPHIEHALATGKAAISQPYMSPHNGDPIAAVAVPILEDELMLSGLLVGLIYLWDERITYPLHQAAALGKTAHSAIVDAEGRIIATTFGLPFLSPGEHAAFYREAIAAGQPVVETVSFELDFHNEPEGHQHVMAFASLQTTAWGVAVGGDVLGETFTGLAELRQGLILVAFLASFGVWGLTLMSSRYVIRPLKRLTLAAQHAAQGNLDTPIHVEAANEIGDLALALEHMRTQLVENIQQLTGWNELLEKRIQEKTQALSRQQASTQQLLRDVIATQEEERSRIARELHDDIGQTISTIELSLNRLAKTVPAENTQSLDHLEQIRALLEQTTHNLRRIIRDMRPDILDKLGLIPALRWVSNYSLKPLGIQTTIETDGIVNRLPSEIETVLFRITQESINNIIKHSHARQVTIHLYQDENFIYLHISDNGQGWNTNNVQFDHIPEGLGLMSIQERAALVGGKVKIMSEIGLGTNILVQIPWQRHEDTFGGESNGSKHTIVNR